ncbi:MAG TPA: OmpA family protein [Gemmatimonadales bacterium]|nr:OmpA family protein [Gemmatimonadales bacterium]
MKVPPLRAAALALAFFASSAAAQGPGTLELGIFGQASYFDRSLRMDQARGGAGARLGIFVLPNVDVEAEGSLVPTDGPQGHIYYMPLRGRVVLNIPSGEHSAFLLGAGVVRSEYRHDANFHDNGLTALVGARVGLPGITTIRVASYLDYIPSPSNGAGNNLNWGIQVGLGFRFGRESSRQPAREEPARVAPRTDSLAMAARADSVARAARAEAMRVQAARDSVAKAAEAQQQKLRDSVRLADARQQALRDSLATAVRQDSLRTAALRDSLRLTQNRARMAALRDSLSRLALRDSLRLLMAQKQTRVTLRGVNFELGKAVLLPVSREILQDVARSLITNPVVRVEVAGHTDSTGSRAVNERLSLARAEAVKVFLIENGVAADRMEVHGYASTQPVATNKTKSGRAQNRRVELRRID